MLSSCYSTEQNNITDAESPVVIMEAVEDKRYEIDLAYSSLKWKGNSITDEHHGYITLQEGYLIKNVRFIGGKLIADMSSIRAVMHEKERDSEKDLVKLSGHLKGEKFFDAENHPNAAFTISKIHERSDADSLGNNHEITGNLMIKGIEKSISFPAKIKETPEAIKAFAEFQIDRTQWGVNYRSETSWANKMISPYISLTIELKANLTE